MPEPIRKCGVTFTFECANNWDDLALTEDESVRFCQKCTKDVYFCSDSNEASHHARLGRCIAIHEDLKPPGGLVLHELERVRRPGPYNMYDVDLEKKNAFDEGARKAFQGFGQAVEQELREVRKEMEAEKSQSRGGSPDSTT